LNLELVTTPFDAWPSPPDDLRLNDDEVHVWRTALNRTETELERLRQTLAPDEVERARRFHFDKHRRHFIIARGHLRCLLSRYLEIEPRAVEFRYSPYGKPSLAPEHGVAPLRFNLSHSGELALYAFTRGRDIGIDVEHVRAEFAGMEIAERFFSRREFAALESLPDPLRTVAFFNCWTRKEAYIKARGEGLSFPLDKFDVSLAPDEPAALLHTDGDAREAERWSLSELQAGTGYAATLAVEGRGWQLRCWQEPEKR
jgi:4'-phosphopantetheinyl transferase